MNVGVSRTMCGRKGTLNIPNQPLVLLLADVRRHLAVDLAGAQCHGQSLGHILADGLGNALVQAVGGANPDLGRALMLKVTGAKLDDLGLGD